MTPLVATILAVTFAVQTITTRAQMTTQRNLRITDEVLTRLDAEHDTDAEPHQPFARKGTTRYLRVMSFVLPFLAVVCASAAVTGLVT